MKDLLICVAATAWVGIVIYVMRPRPWPNVDGVYPQPNPATVARFSNGAD